MKIDKLKTNKLSNYYRTSAYLSGLEKIAGVKSTTLYPLVSNDLKINRIEGLKLSPTVSKSPQIDDKVEAIKAIGEDDFYA